MPPVFYILLGVFAFIVVIVVSVVVARYRKLERSRDRWLTGDDR